MASEEEILKQKLEDLQKKLGKKQMFEEVVATLKSLLRTSYPSASPSIRELVRIFDKAKYLHLSLSS